MEADPSTVSAQDKDGNELTGDAFVKASDEYTAASSAKGESASSVKKPLVSAINDRLVPYLTAMAMANGTVYGDFALKAEKEISRVNETVSRRGK